MERSWYNIGKEEYSSVASEIVSILNSERISILCLKGDLGAGKTTFSKSLFEVLDVIDEVQSPTFSIVNEYHNIDGAVFYHFDFYRFDKIEHAYDIGYEEYFYSGNLCVVEWPEMIEGLLNLPKATIFINGEGSFRNLILSV
jgi:tRNA threonylcarbamoyladenosine biosynthesis protein TsaE